MSAPDPEGLSLLAKVIAAGTAVAAPIGWLWAKLDKKADKAEVDRQRDNIAKIFEKMEDHAQRLSDHASRDEQLFREVLGEMGKNHSELLREMGRKQDR